MTGKKIKGRGISQNPTGRYEMFERESVATNGSDWEEDHEAASI